MLIFLFLSEQKKEALPLAQEILHFFRQRKVDVAAEEEVAAQIGATPLSHIDPNAIDFFLSLGGDGTILRLAHKYEALDAPILGVNLGHLGFMADIPLSDLYPSLEDLLQGAYKIDERVIIQGESTTTKHSCFAINDIVIHRGRNPGLVEIAISVDGTFLNTFVADGVIVATPNGSTAYSLAAGGPILSPRLEAIAITPISPHTISNRPMVLTASEQIEIEYQSHYDPVEVRADGITHFQLQTQGRLKIFKSQKRFRLVSILRRDYFSTLRTKLGWAGKLE